MGDFGFPKPLSRHYGHSSEQGWPGLHREPLSDGRQVTTGVWRLVAPQEAWHMNKRTPPPGWPCPKALDLVTVSSYRARGA